MLRASPLSEIHIVSNQLSTLINPPFEQNLERLAKLAKRMFNVPIVIISFFDEKRLSSKPIVSVDVPDVDQYLSLVKDCDGDDILVVENTAKHEVFSSHPLVSADPMIRFIVSCPIYEKRGKKVGTLLLLDFKPHEFALTDLANINDLVRLIETEVNDSRLSSAQKRLLKDITPAQRAELTDTKTRSWTSDAFMHILNYQLEESASQKTLFAVVVVDVDNLTEINKKYGEEIGDELLKRISKTIVRSCRDEDTIARGAQEDFLVIIHAGELEHIKTVVNRMLANINKEEIPTAKGPLKINVTLGVSVYNPEGSTLESILQEARIAMLKGKRSGRHCAVFYL